MRGYKELRTLPKLHSLELYKTQVTDAGLKELASFKHLKTVGLGKTRVTKAGIEEFKKALPKVRIEE